jgi:lipid-binding SYLF domain-containing protein
MIYQKRKPACVFLAVWSVFVFSLAASGLCGQQESKEVERVENAIAVFKGLVDLPEEGIPPALLRKAQAMALIPDFWKAAYVVGGRHGKGVILARRDEGGWSYPVFIEITGGSVGFQIGVEKADIILVFKNKGSLKDVAKGKFTLGAGAGVAAGPIGRKAEASTDIAFEAEIYSYSRSKGLFAGVAIEGAALSIDKDANAAFYRDFDLTAEDILARGELKAPPVAEELRKIIALHAR